MSRRPGLPFPSTSGEDPMTGVENNSYSHLAGATRPSDSPRLHSLSKPYSRPSSYAGRPNPAHPLGLGGVDGGMDFLQNYNGVGFNGIGGGFGNDRKSPQRSRSPKRPIQTTRPGMVKSNSSASLTRSGSESSLFSLAKNLLSKPLQWLATPSKPTPSRKNRERFDADLEDPMSEHESPLQRRGVEGRHEKGEYEPDAGNGSGLSVTGRAISGFMIPPLPAHVTLTPKSSAPRQGGMMTNYSRPMGMVGSKSMPYMDPPPDILSPARNTRSKGLLTRSKRMDLAALANDEEDVPDTPKPSTSQREERRDTGEKRRREEEPWSPWKHHKISPAPVKRPATPSRQAQTPTRMSENREYALPSASPFRAPPSPSSPRFASHQPSSSHTRQPSTGLTRAATTANIRRQASVASDISMGRSPGRALRPSSSMLFTSNGALDDRMSVDGGDGDRDREKRENSVLQDWFMRDRWGSASPASQAASKRLSSLAPSTSMPKIRKGPLVWDGDRGFVRESDLRADQQPAVPQNEAERILMALESFRKTPLSDARKPAAESQFLPPELVGASSRSIRKAVQVPLATAQAGASAKQRRENHRLGDERTSILISPYGRRLHAEKAVREARQREEMREMDTNYRPSSSPSRSPSEARTEVSSRASAPSPSPSRSPDPAGTPRRSTRLRREPSRDVSAESEETPKGRKANGKGRSIKKAVVDESTPRRSKRQATVDKATSPPPPPVPHISAVPMITETAPSPSDKSKGAAGYTVLQDGELPKGSSSLRAKTMSKRTHTGAASYSSSRATSPTGSAGRFSAREEDLPPMEELEQVKIPLPSFSGISFGALASNPVSEKAVTSAAAPEQRDKPTAPVGGSLLSRLGPPRAETPKSPRLGSTLLNSALSTRPRASSPLAGHSITAQPDSPPEKEKSKPSSSSVQPDSTGFFSLTGTKPAASLSLPTTTPPVSNFFAPPSGEGKKKSSLSLGIGKPPVVEEKEKAQSTNAIPDFFSKSKSAVSSGTNTPVTATPPVFNFGLPSKPAEPVVATPTLPAPTGTFNFGLPKSADVPAVLQGSGKEATTSSTATFNFGNKPSEPPKSTPSPFGGFGTAKMGAATTTPAFNFGTPSSQPSSQSNEAQMSKPAEAPKPTTSFSFTPSAPDEAAKPAFNFGAPTTSAAPATETLKVELPKSTFAFGASSSPTPRESSPAFNFGSSTPAPAAPTEAPKSTFNFGAPASTSSNGNGGSTANPFSGFKSTIGTQSTGTSSTPANGGFTFGKPETASSTSSTSGAAGAFTFGKPAETPAFSFGRPAESKESASGGTTPAPNPFSPPSTSTAPAPGFSFGPTNPSNGFGSSNPTSTPASAPAPSNPFGTSQPSSTVTFGAPTTTATVTNNTFGNPVQTTSTSSFSFNSSNPTNFNSNPFGPPQPTSTFNFSAPPPAQGFGANPNPNPFGAPQQSSAGFTFAAPSSQFSFAPSTPSAPTPGPGFQFGASTTNNQPFVFGAGAGTGTGAASPGATPRFGSPGPATPEGGFSMGVAGDTPGSPSGRKIKGLRRTVKR